MPFGQMMRDELTLLKSDGTRIEGIKGLVSKGKIHIMRSDIHIEPGDEIIRSMPGGNFEEYIVLEPNYHQGLGQIKAHYQAEVRRKSELPGNKEYPSGSNSQPAIPTSSNTYNFYGANSRVNNHSTDNSINNVGTSEEINEALKIITAARNEIQLKPSIGNDDKETAEAALASVEGQLKADKPSRPVIKAITGALPDVVKALPSIVKLLDFFKD